MGFFKEKKIRDEKKYYWVIAKRDSKKLGGTGKVKTIEFYLGDRLGNLKYLSWYLWNNDINLNECLNKLIIFELNKYHLKNDVTYELTSENKLILRSNKNSYIDLRKKIYQDIKKYIQNSINQIIHIYQKFNESINEIIKWLEFYNDSIQSANEKRYKNTDSYFLNCDIADSFFKHSQSTLERLLKEVPKPQRDIAKDRIWGYCLRKCPLEKLDL